MISIAPTTIVAFANMRIIGPSPSSYEGTATGEGYVRVLIRDASGGAWALTNPVFVKIGRRPAAAHRACP